MQRDAVIPKGSLVYSTKGHDKGGLFITISKSEEGYVLLADGMTRKIQKPKRKKVIHIELTGLPVINITDLTNKKARSAVKKYMKEATSHYMPKG